MNFRKSRQRTKANSISLMVTSGEKWRKYSRRMSVRGDIVFNDDDLDEYDPQHKEIKDWVQEFFERKSVTLDATDQDVEVHLTKKQTLILSTLVPDELLLMEKYNSSEPKRFVGVLLMADVSGYTALSERYNNTGKGGTYRLTATLNTYLGSLTEVIYSHGGDILKFAGDAFLALWKTDKRSFLCHTIHKVIACALVIQHSFANYETDVKVNLKVKLAISAGNLMFSTIGNGIDMNYVIFGLPVIEAKATESSCPSGEVKLAPTAWGHCYSRNYDHVIDSKGNVTIKSILYDPREDNVTKPFGGLGSMLRKVKTPFNAIENLPDFLWDTSKPVGNINALKKNEALSLRKAILIAEDKGSEIRRFMIRPVLTQIDAHQPLEYLTEMRQVSVVFVTLKPKECSFLQLITIVNNSYQITCEIVYRSMGCVNKIILFDKDVMILVIFGLRGFKHESEAQAALKCAYNIRRSLSVLNGVSEVSIGVTTGQVYCGVVGHPLRREFTVIGGIVNKAARLMCGYRNKITCDETTFVKSKMSANGFTLQPKKELKGIGTPGNIYEYTEDIRVKELYDIPMIPPILNRTDEIEYFGSWLQENPIYRDFDGLLIVGEPRIGKSKTLEWMARYARNKVCVISYVYLTSIHSETSYLGLSQIVDQMLELKEPIEGFKKEERIVEVLKSYSDNLCYLNNILKTRFAYHDGIHTEDENMRKEKSKLMFTQLVKAFSKKYVIFIDNLQNLDDFSWDYISLMLPSKNIYTVLTITRGKFSNIHNWLYNVFINDNIRKMSIEPLDPEWVPPLACQILDVNAVPHDLCNTLQEKCKGNPGLVETFLIHLFSTGAIEIKRIQESEIDEWKNEINLEFPDPSLLHPQAINNEDQNALDELIESNANGEIGICLVINKDGLNADLHMHNINALKMIQIDSLTPYQQLLLKIASVIGDVIPRHLLENIMYENNSLTTAKAIKRLFAMRILSCANADSLYQWKHEVKYNLPNDSKSKNLYCDCNFEYDPDNSENLPKYAFCKLLRFKNKHSQKTCYELLPINQKKEFHSRIVTYLENYKQKCTSCGGASMIVESMLEYNNDEQKIRGEFRNIQRNNIEEHITDSDSDNRTKIQYTNSSARSEGVKKAKSESNSTAQNSSETTKASSDMTFDSDSANRPKHIPSILKTSDTITTRLMGVFDGKTTKKVTLTADLQKLPLDEASSNENYQNKFYDILREITEAHDMKDWHNIGIIDSTDDIESFDTDPTHFSVNIEKGVSQTDFTKCACLDLNIIICEQIVYHAYEAEMKQKAIEFLIRYAYLSVVNGNEEKLFCKLDEAEELCELLHTSLNPFDYKRYMARIYSIRATMCLNVGRLLAAKSEIEKAYLLYRIYVHKVPKYLKLKNVSKLFHLHRQEQRTQETILKADSLYCLNTATLLYNLLGDERLTRMTSARALDIVQTVKCPFVDMCEAYSNALQVELDRGTPDATEEIEAMATRSLRQLSEPIKSDELFAIGKLFQASFRARIARGRLAPTIRSGFRAIAISRFLQAEDITLEIIPDLFYILLTRRRIAEAVDILQFCLCSNQISYESEMWYYALCMDMILDGGFQLESPNDISRYAEYAVSKGKSAGPSRRRLIVGLWLYWLRADSERKAKRFESEALNWLSHDNDFNSMTSILSAMRLAEGMLESLASKVDDLRKVVDMMELRSIADRELAKMENETRLTRTLYPHWCLLKAFSAKLSDRQMAANNYLKQAMDESRRMHNHLEVALIDAANLESTTWLQNSQSGKFPNWREGVEYAEASAWHQLMYRVSGSRQGM